MMNTAARILLLLTTLVLAGGAAPADGTGPALTRETQYWRGSREQTPGAFLCRRPDAADVIVTSDRWPDASDLRRFAEDAIRLSGAKTPQDEALAVWRWVRRLKVHTDGNPPTEKLVLGGSGYVTDPIKILNVYGAHYCGGLSRVAELIWRAAGRRAQRVHCGSHSMADLFYRDADGVGRYHLFDVNFGGYMLHHARTRLMTLDEYGFDYNGGKTNWIHKTHSPWPTHRIELALRIGEKLERIWGNWQTPYQSHMDPKRDTRRTPLFERGPYTDRTFGNGRWTYAVPLASDGWTRGLAEPPDNVHAVDGALQPVKAGRPAAAVWRVRTPYIIADAKVRLRIRRRSAADRIRLLLSVDEGATWKPAWECPATEIGSRLVTADICPRFEVTAQSAPPAGFHSPFGRYAYRLKLELLAEKRPQDCRVEAITIETICQQSLYALPQLQPGVNRITVRGRVAERSALKVTYTWDDPLGKARRNVTIVERPPHTYTILAAGRKWADCRCRSLTVEAVPATGEGNRTTVKEAPAEVHEMPPMRPVIETRGRGGWWQRSDPKALPPVAKLVAELPDPRKRGAALKGLQELRSPAAFDAVRKVAYEEADVLLKNVALVTLFATDRTRSRPILADMLAHAEKVTWTGQPVKKGPQNAGQHWAYTAVLIGQMAAEAGWAEFGPLLVKVLESKHVRKHVSHAIMRTFVRLGDERIAPAVRRALKRDNYAGAYAARAAARLGLRDALPDIRRLLKARERIFRAYAAAAVGRLGDAASAPALREMLTDPDEDLRAAAAEALGRMRDRASAARLRQVLAAEPIGWVREMIRQAIESVERPQEDTDAKGTLR